VGDIDFKFGVHVDLERAMVTSHGPFYIFSPPKISLERHNLETSNFVHWFATWNISLQIDK